MASRLSLLLPALLLLVTACAPAPGGSREARPLLVVGPWEITGIDPSLRGYIFQRMEVAETLLGVDEHGQPLPGLASRWEVSADRREWRFTLREAARFHDGTRVTPATVAMNLRRAADQPGAFSHVAVEHIEPTSDGVLIHLAEASNLLPAVLAHYSTLILAASAFGPDGRVVAMIGSGPYEVSDLTGQGFAVALQAQWDGPTPAIRQARYLSVGRSETRALMAQSGEADLVSNLDPASLARLRTVPRVRVLERNIPRTTFIKVNSAHPFFSDRRAREALSLAIDRAGIASGLMREPEVAAYQLFPPVMAGWHDPQLSPLRTDPARARALLAELGWRAGADGILERAGERFAITLVTYADRPELALLATALQAQWREIGIALRVSLDNSSAIPAGHHLGTLELALSARNYANIADAAGTLAQDFGPRGGDWGAMGWADARVNHALQTLVSGAPAAADRQRALVAGVLQAELPVIPVVWYRQVAAHSDRVRGVWLDPFERSYGLSTMEWTP